MKKNEKFILFLESMKVHNPALVEAVKTGFKTCFESEYEDESTRIIGKYLTKFILNELTKMTGWEIIRLLSEYDSSIFINLDEKEVIIDRLYFGKHQLFKLLPLDNKDDQIFKEIQRIDPMFEVDSDYLICASIQYIINNLDADASMGLHLLKGGKDYDGGIEFYGGMNKHNYDIYKQQIINYITTCIKSV